MDKPTPLVRTLKIVAPIAAGILAGVGSSFLLRAPAPRPAAPTVEYRVATPRPAASPPPAAPTTTPAGAGNAAELARLRAMERRLAQVESRAAASPGNAPAPPPPDTDPESMRAAHMQAFQAVLQRHAHERVDARWAPTAQRSLQTDLAGLSEANHFRVVQVDCRTNLCVTTLEWPTYESATEATRNLLHQNYQLNCSRRILLPDPGDPAASYQARMVLDCEGAEGRQLASN